MRKKNITGWKVQEIFFCPAPKLKKKAKKKPKCGQLIHFGLKKWVKGTRDKNTVKPRI